MCAVLDTRLQCLRRCGLQTDELCKSSLWVCAVSHTTLRARRGSAQCRQGLSPMMPDLSPCVVACNASAFMRKTPTLCEQQETRESFGHVAFEGGQIQPNAGAIRVFSALRLGRNQWWSLTCAWARGAKGNISRQRFHSSGTRRQRSLICVALRHTRARHQRPRACSLLQPSGSHYSRKLTWHRDSR